MGAEAAIMGLSAAGTASNATGAFFNAQRQREIASNNAELAERAARDARQRGAVSEREHRRQVRSFIGSQRAALAAQGVDVNDGTAVDLQADSAMLGELDALTIRNNAAMEAFGFQRQASSFRNQGRAAVSEGAQNAAGTILGGGSDLALKHFSLRDI